MNPIKRTVSSNVVKLLFHTRTERGMRLIPFAARCVTAGEVHELVSTDQVDPALGAIIDRVGFLGFVEIQKAGVIERGDLVHLGLRRIGLVVGFDDCHAPNHYNILIGTETLITAASEGLAVEDTVTFSPGAGTEDENENYKVQIQ